MAGGSDRAIFFFQAEDGIRDRNVTGVQTCALPIFALISMDPIEVRKYSNCHQDGGFLIVDIPSPIADIPKNTIANVAIAPDVCMVLPEIGRASCRERV